MESDAATPQFPTTFVILAFAVSIAIGLVIAYLGITGRIGAGVP